MCENNSCGGMSNVVQINNAVVITEDDTKAIVEAGLQVAVNGQLRSDGYKYIELDASVGNASYSPPDGYVFKILKFYMGNDTSGAMIDLSAVLGNTDILNFATPQNQNYSTTYGISSFLEDEILSQITIVGTSGIAMMKVALIRIF